MGQPNRPPCGDLTPHEEHLITSPYSDSPHAGRSCPGVPNLAEPAAQQPLSRGDDLRQALGAALSQVYEAQHALTGWHADSVTLSDAAWTLVEPLIAARDARVRAQALRDFAEAMRTLAEDAPADEPAKWPWSGYALAAVKAEEYAGKGLPCPPAGPAGDGGTPTHPEAQEGS
jgi:hypothetical protein